MPPQPAGFANALKVFHRAAEEVPAYRDYLDKYGIDHTKIESYADFQLLPPVTKENYLKKYPLKDLLFGGRFDDARIISMSSGSSGVPFFWFRGNQANKDSVAVHERIFNDSFHTQERSTLVIISFAMGTWIAGTYTTTALMDLADKGHKIVLINPGINKAETVHILKNLAPNFDQTVLAAYPPMAKDILDEAAYQGVDLPSLNLHLLFAGEGFSENWRDNILKLVGKPGDLSRTVAIYGTADAGCMGHESPLSQFIRRKASENPDLCQALFGTDNHTLPTLVHTYADMRFPETDGEFLLFTINNSIPLVRYKILDRGYPLTAPAMSDILGRHGVKIPAALHDLHDRPYVCLFNRTDVATIFYSLNIYPENIKHGLEQPQLMESVTGKFILKTEYNKSQEQILTLLIELKHGAKETLQLAQSIQDNVTLSLRKLNSEYNRLYQELKEQALPNIELVEYGSPQFQVNVKHRWIAPSPKP